MSTELSGVVAEHIAAVNALDTGAVVATFAEDAYGNDNHRTPKRPDAPWPTGPGPLVRSSHPG